MEAPLSDEVLALILIATPRGSVKGQGCLADCQCRLFLGCLPSAQPGRLLGRSDCLGASPGATRHVPGTRPPRPIRIGGVPSLGLVVSCKLRRDTSNQSHQSAFFHTPALIAAVETHVESSSPWTGVAANLDGIYLLEIRILLSSLQEFLPTRCVRLNHYILYQAPVLLAFSHSFFFWSRFCRTAFVHF